MANWVSLECSPKETSKIKSNISARQCSLACGTYTAEVHKIIVSSPQMIFFFLISRRFLDWKKTLQVRWMLGKHW